MTFDELREKWEARRAEHARLDSHVSAEKLIADLLTDLEQLEHAAHDAVTLTEAAHLGGYSVDRLQKLVAGGEIENVGKKHRPRIRRSDVPMKPGHRLPPDPAEGHFPVRRRIVDSVLTGE
jgi:hypothetical protein